MVVELAVPWELASGVDAVIACMDLAAWVLVLAPESRGPWTLGTSL
jgi:hypothetical protein